MAYELEISVEAENDLRQLDRPVLEVFRSRLRVLVENAETSRHLGITGKLKGLYKLRFYGKYRVIYELNQSERRIIVVRVGKRDEICKD